MAKFEAGDILCSNKDCSAFVKNHAWGKIKAEGWFFSRDGEDAYCPDHIPDWVHEWRKKRNG